MSREREIQEAIQAGSRALDSLEEAREYLRSAGNWGIVDILGGGLFTGLIKHSKLNSATACMEAAREDLRRFQTELRDVAGLPEIQLEVGDFLRFADFFFDGFVADFMVQSKIAQAREQVEQAIEEVSGMLGQLHLLL